jgi:hypothetical protein
VKALIRKALRIWYSSLSLSRLFFMTKASVRLPSPSSQAKKNANCLRCGVQLRDLPVAHPEPSTSKDSSSTLTTFRPLRLPKHLQKASVTIGEAGQHKYKFHRSYPLRAISPRPPTHSLFMFCQPCCHRHPRFYSDSNIQSLYLTFFFHLLLSISMSYQPPYPSNSKNHQFLPSLIFCRISPVS